MLILTVNIANAEPTILSYKYNDYVVISIASVPCPHKNLVDTYPFGAVAKRVDGQYLFGCYKKESENDIKIQWVDGDFTVLPANAFLQKPAITIHEIAPTL